MDSSNEVKQNIENIQDELQCQICMEYPEQPVGCKDCQRIYCHKCVNDLKKKICPNCRSQDPSFQPNKFAQRMINQMVQKCPFECGQSSSRGNMKDHLKLCEKKSFKCKYCELQFTMSQFFDHIAQAHSKKAIQLFIQKEEEEEEKSERFEYLQNNEDSKQINIQVGISCNIISKNSGFALDIAGGSKQPANLIQWGLHGQANQQFVFEKADNTGNYLIRAVHSGLFLDVKEAKKENNTELIQWQKHGGPNQQFQILQVGNQSCKIKCVHSNKVFEAKDQSSAQGAKIIQHDINDRSSQLFQIQYLQQQQQQQQQLYQQLKQAKQQNPLSGMMCNIYSVNSGLVFDIDGGSMKEKANLIQYGIHNQPNQQFILESADNQGKYFIKCVKSGLFLDVSGGKKDDGAQIIQFKKHGGANQQFQFEELENMIFKIKCVHSNKYLDVKDQAKNQCAKIIQNKSSNNPSQRFIIKNQQVQIQISAAFNIISNFSGLALDIAGASTQNEAALIQWDLHNGPNQQFTFEVADGKHYCIKSKKSGLLLDVYGAKHENGTYIIQWEKNNMTHQTFEIIEVGNQLFKIKAAHSNKVLDIHSKSKSKGARIIQNDSSDSPSQLFKIKYV